MDATRRLVLLVDDDPASRRVMEAMLADLAEVAHAADGSEARRLAHELRPALVLLDLDLGAAGDDRAGLEVCRALKALPIEPPLHVMLVSGTGDAETRLAGYDAGADDFLAKPFDRRELAAKAAVHLRHHEAVAAFQRMQAATESAAGRLSGIVEEQARGIIVARTMTARALAALAENRDADTGDHLDRMRDYAVALAEELRREGPYAGAIDGRFIEQLHHAAPLHDIGKVAIPDAILLKPGRLTAEEFTVMQTHTAAGARVLEAIRSLECDGGIADEASFMPMAVEIARSHHERWDGTGYPDRLAGEAIPLAARITAAADVLDALASARVYKPAMPFEQVRGVILEARGSHFDPVVADALDRAWPRLRAIRERFGDAERDAAAGTAPGPAAAPKPAHAPEPAEVSPARAA